jgi:hypothetical protein
MTEPAPRWGRTSLVVAWAVLSHPSLAPSALGALRRLAPPRWWGRAPFLPLPAPAYWRFRLKTAFGDDASARLSVRDVTSYLRWCRETRRSGT